MKGAAPATPAVTVTGITATDATLRIPLGERAAPLGGAPPALTTTVGGGRFELVCLAGAGGMGAVHRAVDRETGAPVAVKLLTGTSASGLARFAREARVLASIEDDTVVRYVAHGHDPQPYLVMEWLDGCDLAGHLAQSRPTLTRERGPGAQGGARARRRARAGRRPPGSQAPQPVPRPSGRAAPWRSSAPTLAQPTWTRGSRT